MSDAYNLDDSVTEYFEFMVLGIKYKFKYMTTEEVEKIQEFAKNKEDKKIKEYMMEFIENVVPSQPSFEKTSKKMLTSHWKNFNEMIVAEFK